MASLLLMRVRQGEGEIFTISYQDGEYKKKSSILLSAPPIFAVLIMTAKLISQLPITLKASLPYTHCRYKQIRSSHKTKTDLKFIFQTLKSVFFRLSRYYFKVSLTTSTTCSAEMPYLLSTSLALPLSPKVSLMPIGTDLQRFSS